MDEDEDVPYSDEIEGEEDEEEEDEEDHFAGQANGIKTRVNGYTKAAAQDSRAGETTTPELFTSAGAQQALHPLRRTADRVTRQIEAFAEKLDRFKQKGNRTDDFGRFQAAYQLVKSYQTFTQDAIQDISKQSTLKRAKMGWSASRNETAAQDPKTEEELQRLQLEANTWQLLLNLISIDNPAGHEMDKEAQETAFQKLHRYSSDREVWEQFLTADPYARECVIVMKWLEHTAKTQSQDIDSLIADLEKQAERGQGLWAHGWLYTKEAIKGQKRLRAWPQPLEPNDPGITISLLRSDKSGALITQLDPDAITRQKHLLQKQDQFHERATWMTCWKMVRQGESWTKIREWAQERLEHWRAVSLCGSSVDKDSHVGKTPVDDGTTRMMNFRSHKPWQSACSALAHNSTSEDFERAVYALLCGETEAAFKVCQNYDDYLYVHFNSVVLGRYQGFCKQFQRRLAFSPTTPATFVPEPAGYNDTSKFLQAAKGNERIGAEARNPYRTIQAVILGRGYDSFFQRLASAVSHVANSKSDGSSYVPELSSVPVDESLFIAAQDEDSLRIATHLYLVADSIGYVRSDTQFFENVSVNVTGYISNLEERDLFDVIPLYASLLPQHLAHSALGQILLQIVDPRERKQQVRLMEKHGINIEAVFEDQWAWISGSVEAVDHSTTVKRYSKVLRRSDGSPYLAPVRKDLIGTSITELDDYMIRSLEWLRYIDGQWGKICHLGAQLYRRFFISGKLAAARELSRRMNLSDLSRESFGFDVAEFPMEMEDGVDASTPEPMSPSKIRLPGSAHKRSRSNGVTNGAQQSILYQQSQTMRDLEALILAFDALENFATLWEKLDKNRRRRDTGTTKNLRVELQEALDEIGLNVDAILDEWLIPADNEPNVSELEEIRLTYIPELFLDYHNALYYAAHVLTGEILVQCMNLGMQVSENEHLTRSFVGAKRMRELVDALAVSSKAMVNTHSEPGKRLLGGEMLGIWNVKVDSEEDDEIRMARS